MSNLAVEAAFTGSAHLHEHRFKRVLRRVEDRVGEDGDAQRLSLSSAGHLYKREGTADRQQASSTTEARSLLVTKDQLVVNPMWLTGGSIAVSNTEGAVSPDYRVFVPDHKLLNARYLHHLLRSQPYRHQYNLFVRANTTFDRRIQQIDLDQMPLWLPHVDEQRRIADFLDDRVARIDQIISARNAQVKLLDQLLLERMRSAVAGVTGTEQGSRPDALPWVERIGEAATILPLARVVTLQRGVDLTDSQRRPGLAQVVTTAGVVGTHDQAIESGPGVVIGRYGSVGNVHWVEGPYWPHNTTLYVKNAQGNELRWLYYLLRTFPYGAMQARAAIPGINRNDLATELVAWIPLEHQRTSIRWLDQCEQENDERRTDLRMSVERLAEYKQSLVTAAVTGEVDVTTVGSGVPG